MGINVISNFGAKFASPANAVSSEAPGGLDGEFAALLGLQSGALSQLASPNLGQALAGTLGEPEDHGNNARQDTGEEDPASIAALLGLQPTVVTAPTTPQAQTDDHSDIVSQTLETIGSATRTAAMPNATTLSLAPSANQETAAQTLTAATGSTELGESSANIAALATDAASNSAANFAAALQQAGKSGPAVHESHSASIPAHLSAGNWPEQFGEKIVWMAKQDLQVAQININPPQLGPVQITLNLSGDQATAVFASPHIEVRQAIESSMPQLREMLASAGINLGDANVGANLAQQNPNTPFQTANGTPAQAENAILPANDSEVKQAAPTSIMRGRGLVDLFA